MLLKEQFLSDEMAAAIWSGEGLTPQDTGEGSGKSAAAATTTEEGEGEGDTSGKAKPALSEEDISKALRGELEGGGDDDGEEGGDGTPDPAKQTTVKPKSATAGRKPEVVSYVNKMVADGEIEGFADGDVDTVEDAWKLIKSNLKQIKESSEEEGYESKKKEFSPQVQAILHYAENGAQTAEEIIDLLGSIREVEALDDYDMNTPEGHEKVIRDTLKSRGFKDKYIDNQIGILKDLGGDKLKETATELEPELSEIKEQKVAVKLREKEQQRKQSEEASRAYTETIKTTLSKDKIGELSLKREDKARLFSALVDSRHISLSGRPTNLFVKTLEELQFGKNQNMEHFLEVVEYAINRAGFLEKLKQSTANTLADDTERKLRNSKTNSQNAQTELAGPGKKTIRRDFVNPFG